MHFDGSRTVSLVFASNQDGLKIGEIAYTNIPIGVAYVIVKYMSDIMLSSIIVGKRMV